MSRRHRFASGIEVFGHPPALRDVVVLIAELDLGIAHLPVEQITPVAFVDQNQIVLVDGRAILRRASENTLDEALDGADVDLGIAVDFAVLKPEDLCDGSEKVGWGGRRYI